MFFFSKSVDQSQAISRIPFVLIHSQAYVVWVFSIDYFLLNQTKGSNQDNGLFEYTNIRDADNTRSSWRIWNSFKILLILV